MKLEKNPYSDINQDDLRPIDKEKILKNLKNETNVYGKELPPIDKNSAEKCFSGPIKDINSVDMGFAKCSPINPDMFENFFADKDVTHAKKLVKEITNASNKGEFADKINELYKLVNKMDKHELIETAQFIGEQMRNTDGKDDILGSILTGVLGELKTRENSEPAHVIDVYKHKIDPGLIQNLKKSHEYDLEKIQDSIDRSQGEMFHELNHNPIFEPHLINGKI